MHVQLIHYRWEGDAEQFVATAELAAPVIAAMDGFVAKYWLRADDGVFGGVYLWRDKEAADAYVTGEFLRTSLIESPELRDFEVRDYDLWEAPTAITTTG
jgi:heme-degrading monooxygenase HmoA